jgi:hypothetical protein
MTKSDLLSILGGLLVGTLLGLAAMANIDTGVTPIIQPPAPSPATVMSERDLVLGMSEVLVDIHRKAEATRKELEAVKTEARQIISAMDQEIQQLQSQSPSGHRPNMGSHKEANVPSTIPQQGV